MRRAAALALIFAAGLAAQSTWKLPPKNEENRDKTLVAYMDRLRKAVKDRDGQALLELVSEDIKNGFGGDDGKAAFIRQWLPMTRDSAVFPILNNILTLGGTFFDANQYCIPYLSQHWPDDIDPFSHHVVTGNNVRLRAEPSASGKVIGSLSWDIVETLEREAEWSHIKTHDGLEGYVATAYTYGPVAYRACILKGENGQWSMRSLLAGD